MAPAADGTSSDASKTVYFIRHAESEQNVAMRRLKRGEMKVLFWLAYIGVDAPLSAYGRTQLEGAPAKLASAGFGQIELVAHSPYMRARQTAAELFREPPFSAIPQIELEWLHERTAPELLNGKGFDLRVARVPGWLQSRPESTIAMVGHGRFFQRLLGLATMQPNIGAVETIFNGTALRVVRQLPLAGEEAHPDAFGKFNLG